jgi:hypothetical protein
MKVKVLTAGVALALSQVAAAEVVIGSAVGGALVGNIAGGPRTNATQNLSSNAGDVTINGDSVQATGVGLLGIMVNASIGGDADQNASSNADHVLIRSGAESTQITAIGAAGAAANVALGGDSYAKQNMSSNFGRVELGNGATSEQTTIVAPLALAINSSVGAGSYAAQNMSSNFGKVTVNGDSDQFTWIAGGVVANLALGSGTAARQNLASNSSCDIDQMCDVYRMKPKKH